MADKKVKVLYILGAGRSGSTLLSNILGQVPGFENVGELYYLWENGLLEGGMCGCGETVLECPFWTPVLKQTLGSSIKREGRRMQELCRQVSRTRHIPLLALPSSRRFLLKRTKVYLETLAQLYGAIQDLTDCSVIVDASKFPSYAQILQHEEKVELYVLHLVRDPRAVGFSWQRRKFNPGTKDTFDRMSLLKSSVIWLTWNLGGEYLRRSLREGRYLRIHYEDFIEDALRTTNQILEFVGETGKHLPFLGKQEVSLFANHSIAGNPVRFRQGNIKLRLDSEWAGHMKSSEKALAMLLTWPLLLKYHYPLTIPVSS